MLEIEHYFDIAQDGEYVRLTPNRDIHQCLGSAMQTLGFASFLGKIPEFIILELPHGEHTFHSSTTLINFCVGMTTAAELLLGDHNK